MWALTLLTVLHAARANSCIRITYATDENGAKTVSKSFAITARSPEACKKNQFSGLGIGGLERRRRLLTAARKHYTQDRQRTLRRSPPNRG